MKRLAVLALLAAVALILSGAYLISLPCCLIAAGFLILLALVDLSRKDRTP